MPTTNLHLTKHPNGDAVKESDLKIGLKIVGPSLTGGVLDYNCISKTESEAVFKSLHKDWPISLVMKLNVPDFSLEDFIQLRNALKKIDAPTSWGYPNEVDGAILKRAHELGYAFRKSQTQAHWTEKGLETLRNLARSFEPVKIKGYTIVFNEYWMEWQLRHEVSGPCGEYNSLKQAIEDAEKG